MSRATRRIEGSGRAGSAAPGSGTVGPVRVPSAGAEERRDGAARRAGLRRVDWVRLQVDQDEQPVRAEAMGAGFRLPVTCAIPLSVAADLIASGTPYVTRHLGTGE